MDNHCLLEEDLSKEKIVKKKERSQSKRRSKSRKRGTSVGLVKRMVNMSYNQEGLKNSNDGESDEVANSDDGTSVLVI